MSPTKGPHQSIRPRAPGALQGPTARRHPRPIGERGEPASWTGHEPGTSLSWSYLCRATLLEGQGLSICDDPWSTHRRYFRTPAAFCCVGILNRLEGGQADPPHPQEQWTMSTHVRQFLFERGSPNFWRALPRPPKRTQEARQIFGERSRVPLQGRPRRGRTSPPP